MINDYMKTLKERNSESRVYQKHQQVGLEIAEILQDQEHKALYMKLARNGNVQRLYEIAKDVAEKDGVKNKGAYFMRIAEQEGILKSKKTDGKQS